MKKISRSSSFWVLAAILCMAPSMVAAVQMQLTGAGGDIAWTSLGGIYINPYTATIDGVSTTVLCDDFGDDTYVNQTWKADVYTADQAIATGTTRLNKEYGGLTGFDTATLTMKYTQVADLAIQLLSASNVSDRAAYSFALWGVFDSTGSEPSKTRPSRARRRRSCKTRRLPTLPGRRRKTVRSPPPSPSIRRLRGQRVAARTLRRN